MTVRAFSSDAAIDRERSAQGQDDQKQCRDRRQVSGRNKGDTWLIPESGKVIEAGQAHYFPPRMRVFRMFGCVLIGARATRNSLHQPVSETRFWCLGFCWHRNGVLNAIRHRPWPTNAADTCLAAFPKSSRKGHSDKCKDFRRIRKARKRRLSKGRVSYSKSSTV